MSIRFDLSAKQDITNSFNSTFRTNLVKTLSIIQEEKSQLVQHSNKLQANYETKIENILIENEVLNEKCNSLNKLNFEQQKQMQKMFLEMDEKKEQSERQANKKIDEIKRLKQMLNLSNEKIKYLNQKHSIEIENLRKKFNKDFDQLRFNNENITIRNGELSRSNLELRKKIQQLESDLKDANEKSFINKQNAELQTKQKKELKEETEKAACNLKKEIQSLELLRDEYLKKSQQQQESVEHMLKQLGSFQSELSGLIERNTKLNEKLKKANSLSDLYKNKYHELKKFLQRELSKIKLIDDKENKNLQLQQEKLIISHTERLYETNKRIKDLIRDLKIEDILGDKSEDLSCLNTKELEIE